MIDEYRKPDNVVVTDTGEDVAMRRATVVASVPARVTVVDFDMSFGHLVKFFIKAAFAAIPAVIIIWIIMAIVVAIVAAVFGTAWWSGAGRV